MIKHYLTPQCHGSHFPLSFSFWFFLNSVKLAITGSGHRIRAVCIITVEEVFYSTTDGCCLSMLWLSSIMRIQFSSCFLILYLAGVEEWTWNLIVLVGLFASLFLCCLSMILFSHLCYGCMCVALCMIFYVFLYENENGYHGIRDFFSRIKKIKNIYI